MESLKLNLNLAEYRSGSSNNLNVTRPFFTLAALHASKDANFLSRIHSKMIVTFKGEEQAIDAGGVARDFFSNLFDRLDTFLLKDRHYSDEEPGSNIEEMDFAAGLFASIAILQESYYHPFIIEAIRRGFPKFLEGMNQLGEIGTFLKEDCSTHVLFARAQITSQQMISLLRRESNQDQTRDLVEIINFKFICKFIEDIYGNFYPYGVGFWLVGNN